MRLPARLDPRRLRRRPDVLLALFIAAVYLALYILPPGGQVAGDGHYSWIIARSLAFDGDLQFTNDYAACGDPWGQGVDRGGGRPANPFYLGPALVWAPMLAVVRKVVTLPADALPSWRAGCAGPWVMFTMVLGPLAGAFTAWLGYRFARRWAGEKASLAAMAAGAFATAFVHFATIYVSYSHVWAALGVGLALLGWMRALEAPERSWRWFVAGLGFGAAALMRNQLVTFLLAPAALLVHAASVRGPERLPVRTAVARAARLGAGFLALFWLQLAETYLLCRRLFPYSPDQPNVQLAHPRPFALLFGARGGLLSWHPILWLALVGLVLLCARRSSRRVGLALALPMLLDFYLISAVDWHGSASFGARRFSTMLVPCIAGIALSASALWAWLRRSPTRLAVFATAGWLLPVSLQNVGASEGLSLGNVPYAKEVPLPTLVGTGFTNSVGDIYRAIGNPFSLPATLLFAVRYRMHPSRWDNLTGGGYFEVVPGTWRVQRDTFVFAAAENAPFVVGDFLRTPAGVTTLAPGQKGRLVVELAWWHVTHLGFSARSPTDQPVTLKVSNNLIFSGHELGAWTIPAAGGFVELPVPPQTFTTGINELTFTADRPIVLETARWRDSDLPR